VRVEVLLGVSEEEVDDLPTFVHVTLSAELVSEREEGETPISAHWGEGRHLLLVEVLSEGVKDEVRLFPSHDIATILENEVLQPVVQFGFGKLVVTSGGLHAEEDGGLRVDHRHHIHMTVALLLQQTKGGHLVHIRLNVLTQEELHLQLSACRRRGGGAIAAATRRGELLLLHRRLRRRRLALRILRGSSILKVRGLGATSGSRARRGRRVGTRTSSSILFTVANILIVKVLRPIIITRLLFCVTKVLRPIRIGAVGVFHVLRSIPAASDCHINDRLQTKHHVVVIIKIVAAGLKRGGGSLGRGLR